MRPIKEIRVDNRRRNKYGNVRVRLDGITFDSKAEYRRWLVLKALQADGSITALKAHPCFDLLVNGVKVCKYVADASYFTIGEHAAGSCVIEDCKGVRTPIFILKKKLMKACLGLTVTEIRA